MLSIIWALDDDGVGRVAGGQDDERVHGHVERCLTRAKRGDHDLRAVPQSRHTDHVRPAADLRRAEPVVALLFEHRQNVLLAGRRVT
jgi:hypothetical protein